MLVNFKYYLHDGSPYEGMKYALKDAGVELTDELYEKIGRPFYEIEFDCTLDTETGAVEILGIR